MTVADLITPNKQWNHALIQSLFPTDISQAIMVIPLHTISTLDTHFWSLTPHGSYTVNSGYHLAHSQLHQNEPTPSDHKSLDAYRCHYHDETLEHALFRCLAAQKLWNCRNIWLHEGLSLSPDQILREASAYFEHYTVCNKKTPTPSPAHDDHFRPNDSCTSSPPFHHWLFVDAAQDSQLLKMGFGMTIHTNSGKVLLNLAKPRSGITTPLLMEAQALYSALAWCHEHSFYPDSIVSDCNVLVNYICKNETHNLHLNPFVIEINPFVIEIKSLLSYFPNVSLSYILRGANHAAHCLAKTALGLEQEPYG
ncbi:hypothetical protein G4B88_017252 [Cannabis sativa]|uniref:RNase H type-1 domain-containing protein n=1 Tax=Cannabis sativa TaxID=3483 RepID=A0A7J6EJ67_CANSA|nr:hypothetical protein G4B88_017252 [Cannabis sativa]